MELNFFALWELWTFSIPLWHLGRTLMKVCIVISNIAYPSLRFSSTCAKWREWCCNTFWCHWQTCFIYNQLLSMFARKLVQETKVNRSHQPRFTRAFGVQLCCQLKHDSFTLLQKRIESYCFLQIVPWIDWLTPFRTFHLGGIWLVTSATKMTFSSITCLCEMVIYGVITTHLLLYHPISSHYTVSLAHLPHVGVSCFLSSAISPHYILTLHSLLDRFLPSPSHTLASDKPILHQRESGGEYAVYRWLTGLRESGADCV